jgi:archaellin
MITMLIITIGGIAAFYESTKGVEQQARQEQRSYSATETPDLTLVSATGSDPSQDSVRYIRIQVRYDGEGALNLNDTFIQLRTSQSVADLTYRNGSLTRSESSGFYTTGNS